MELLSVINSASLAVLIVIVIRSFEIGKKMGELETFRENTAEEVKQLRQNMHRLSEAVARLSARDEMRDMKGPGKAG